MNKTDLWSKPTDFPDVLSEAQNGFSVDVLVYSKKTDEHTIGWFDYNQHKWHFLSNEVVKNFRWRYLDNEIDKY